MWPGFHQQVGEQQHVKDQEGRRAYSPVEASRALEQVIEHDREDDAANGST